MAKGQHIEQPTPMLEILAQDITLIQFSRDINNEANSCAKPELNLNQILGNPISFRKAKERGRESGKDETNLW